jgi:hypothetical protein
VRANILWLFGEGHPAKAGAPGRPGLNLDDYFAVLTAGEFLGRRHSIISGGDGAATGNFESVGGENGFALIFVKSCHGRVLFRMKTPNVQRRRAELSIRVALVIRDETSRFALDRHGNEIELS